MDQMLSGERQALIGERLARDGRVIAADIAVELAVSEDTIRRDLRDMARAGLCRRVYGGALPAAPASAPLAERADTPEKARLAAKAVELVIPGSVVFIDAGSTNAAIARALPHDLGVTIVTNAPTIAVSLLGHKRAEVILVGGRLDKEKGAVLGARALSEIARLRPDLAFLGACGVDAAAGVTAFSFEEAEIKRALAEASRSVAVAATADKLGTAAPFAVLDAERLTHLVVPAEAGPAAGAAWAACGTRLHIAG